MQNAETILQAIRKMGEKRIPLTRVYRCLFSEDLLLAAYDNIARNRGALTKGTEDDTADGMNLTRIRTLIAALRQEQFKFKPSRRVQIPKAKGTSGTRPLSIPNFTDKLVQEALRLILNAYYEPRFRNSSHGFRPERGCHTALTAVSKFKGTTWFIEGDIRGCFDNIDHTVLMCMLGKDIQDGRLLNLIRMNLDAGYMEDWHYNRTYSGTPQGGVLSPLLANIYLNELDTFIEDDVIPRYTRGERRRHNCAYANLGYAIKCARAAGDDASIRSLEQQRRQTPSQDPNDDGFRRLRYVRYADDFLLSFVGPKAEAEAIKTEIGAFLKESLRLELSESKTLVTHARTEHARFLGYAISVYHADDKLSPRTGTPTKTRGVNGVVRLGIPFGRVDELAQRYLRNGKPIHEGGLINYPDAEIVEVFQQRFRGVAEYYKFAADRNALGKLKFVMEVALTKTLANKHKGKVTSIYRMYARKRTVDGSVYTTLEVDVLTKHGTRTVYWGAIPLKVVKPGTEAIDDNTRRRNSPLSARTDLVRRLQAGECEVCGSQEPCDVHHIHKLADLRWRWQGRKEKPEWVKRMIALQRKTLIVCPRCHTDIHAGRPLSRKRMMNSGEPDDAKVSSPVRREDDGKVPSPAG
jgi:group II intron reverse transcriptase/maturase